jgi:16S rRNA (guanine527-N7)-methyltransferase
VPAEVVISRAFRDLSEWLRIARPYVAPGGRVLAMLGRTPGAPEELVTNAGGRLLSFRSYRLPFSQSERALAVVTFDRG